MCLCFKFHCAKKKSNEGETGKDVCCEYVCAAGRPWKAHEKLLLMVNS